MTPISIAGNRRPRRAWIGHPRQRRRGVAFTLIELLIVLLILVLALSVVAPRVGRVPNRVAIRRAHTDLENAISAAARRARATGATVELRIGQSDGVATIGDLSGGRAAALPPAADAPAGKRPDDQPTIKLTKDIIWGSSDALPTEPEEGVPLVYIFYPNGEAAGPTAPFTVRKQAFQLDVDPLTGHPIISELAE